MWNWDYDLPKNWQPKTDAEWEWFLVRKLTYADFEGLKKADVTKYFPRIKMRLDPATRAMLDHFLNA